ncbi:Sluggish A, isoform A, partial [Operophtera brumata]
TINYIAPFYSVIHSASISTCGDKQEEGQLKQFHVEQRFADRRYKVTSARTYFYLNEAACEKNMDAFLKSIDAVAAITKSTGLMAVKMTALGRPQLLLQLSEVIMRARNYMQQIGGGNGNVLTHHKTIEDFQRYFGDHSSKPEVQDIVHLFPWTNILDEDMNLSDSFRVPDPKTGQMRRLISQISTKEEEMFRNMLRRLNVIIKAANEVDVRVMIDAEQTYFQPAISRICLEMMRRYNKDKFLVFNTYQTYLKNTYQEIVTDLEQAKRQNFYWGAKFVRGAYIEQERARAAAMGYEDPTCESDTVRYAIQLMKEHNIKPEDRVVCFGQLLGMCDHITFPLEDRVVCFGQLLGMCDHITFPLDAHAAEDRVVCFGQLLGMCDHITFPLEDRAVCFGQLLGMCDHITFPLEDRVVCFGQLLGMCDHMTFPLEDRAVCFGQLLGMCDHITFPLVRAVRAGARGAALPVAPRQREPRLPREDQKREGPHSKGDLTPCLYWTDVLQTS